MQNTEAELRFSDWISDVCSSDLESDRGEAPGEGARGWCAPREAWPVEPLRTTLRFVQGESVALDGNEMPGHELLARLNMLFARYGVGRGLYTGDTTIG